MQVSASLVNRGNKIMVGKSACEVVYIIQDFGKITFQTVTPSGKTKNKSVKSNAIVKVQ